MREACPAYHAEDPFHNTSLSLCSTTSFEESSSQDPNTQRSDWIRSAKWQTFRWNYFNLVVKRQSSGMGHYSSTHLALEASSAAKHAAETKMHQISGT